MAHDLLLQFSKFDVLKEVNDILSHFGEQYREKLKESVDEAKKEGRRLQAFYDPFLSATVDYTYKPPMYLKEINEYYFDERKSEKQDPNFKNPFDKIDNSYPNYDKFSARRQNNETTKFGEKRAPSPTIFIDGVEIPAEVNWNKDLIFTPVKDQMDCNACYAFGAISGVEAHQSIYNKNQKSYSEQEILDCSMSNEQCTGG